ncbi:hypothetical protein TWF730_008653 [Orbilia blumenaviensis]|uniref:F-box domain-containing protein n=1 Tax=Orbilia blumenaviensis TaxID=1796055 RepID=A0AAV9V9J4_9PEZI
MTSLLSLPPELTDQIFTYLPLSSILTLRLLNHTYNHKFQHPLRTILFTNLTLNLRAPAISHLTILPAPARAYIKHITFTRSPLKLPLPKTLNKKKDPQPNLINALSNLPNLKSIDFDLKDNISDYWTPIIKALLANHKSSTTLTSLKTIRISPTAYLTTPDLTSSLPILSSSSKTPIFRNLKTLEISITLLYDRPKHIERVWEWISSAAGPTLTSLILINTSQISPEDPWPLDSRHHHSSSISSISSISISDSDNTPTFLPKTFHLPRLRGLKLQNLYLTIKDLHHLLTTSSKSLESIDLHACYTQSPKHDWFNFLSLLHKLISATTTTATTINNDKEHTTTTTTRTSNLSTIHLALQGHHRNISSYELPEISIITDSSCPTTFETVLHSPPNPPYITKKDIFSLLPSTSKNPNKAPETSIDTFWSSLTDSKWNSQQVTRYKRLRALSAQHDAEIRKLRCYAQYDYDMAASLEEKYQASLQKIKAEAD